MKATWWARWGCQAGQGDASQSQIPELPRRHASSSRAVAVGLVLSLSAGWARSAASVVLSQLRAHPGLLRGSAAGWCVTSRAEASGCCRLQDLSPAESGG